MITVSFIFDPAGFGAYDDIKDPACLENLADLFHGILRDRLQSKSEALSMESPNREPYLQAVEEDIALAKKILETMKIQESR